MIGMSSSAVSAVHDGYVLQKSVVHSPLGGKLLTQCMLQSIQSKGVMVHPAYTFKRTEITPGQFEVGSSAYLVSSAHSCIINI